MRQYEDLLIDALLDSGFSLDEALRLIELQNRVEHESEQLAEERVMRAWFESLGGKVLLN